MLLVSTRWPSCCKSCKQPISRTDVLTKGVVEISTCSGGCAWNSEVPLVDSIKIIDGDLAQWEMKVGSNSFLFLNLNNSSFQRIMLGFVCSGMIDCQHESLEDSRWPDVVLFLTQSETTMNHEWKLKHRSIRVIFTQYIYIKICFYIILWLMWIYRTKKTYDMRDIQ